jgi:hypothetical protein
MGRLTAAWLIAGCLGFQMWAQTPPAQSPAAPPTAAEQVPSGQPAPNADPSQSPLEKFKEFSAIMVGGPVPGTADPIHVYRSGNLMRMEAHEGKSYQITDLVKQETHGQARTGCLHYKVPYVRAFPFSFSVLAEKFERAPVGKETVDGHVCQVEDVTFSVPKHVGPVKVRLWEAEDLQGFPIKIETGLHRTIEYQNVVLGPQDPTLFIFPLTCQNSEETIGKLRSPADKAKKAPAEKPKQ